MAGGIWDPRKRRKMVAIVAVILIAAMVIPTVMSLMIGWFIDEVSGFEDLFTEFSENLWLGLVDVMVVVDKKNFRVKFKSGMEVPVEL